MTPPIDGSTATPAEQPRDPGRAAPARVPPQQVMLAPGISILPLIQLQDSLEPFETNASDVEGQAARAEITDQASYQAGSDLLTAIQGQLRDLEAARTAAKKPADDYGKMVQKLVLPIQDRFNAAKSALSGKMLRWRTAEEARQRAAQEEIRRQQEAEANRLAEEARAKGNESTAEKIEEMMAAAPAAPAPRVGHANAYGRTTQKRVFWNGSAHDPMLILKNVVAGNLPLSLVEFSKSGMNAVAKKHIESLPENERKDTVHLGIKIEKSETLV